MEFFITWVAFSIFASIIAGNKGRSGTGFFLLSIILSPLIGIVAALIAKPNHGMLEIKALKSGHAKQCPYCAELIKQEANVCKHCGHDQPDVIKPSQSHIFKGYTGDKIITGLFLLLFISCASVLCLDALLRLSGFDIRFSPLQWLTIVAPALIYADATRNNIGKVKAEKGRDYSNMPAGAWGIFAILLLIITLPLYLFNRVRLKEKAKLFPVKVGTVQKILITLLLLISATAIQWGIAQSSLIQPKTEISQELPASTAPIIYTQPSGSATTTAQQLNPKLHLHTGQIVDDAHILSPLTIEVIDEKLTDFERRTGNQIIVVTVSSLQGFSIEDYSDRLNHEWQINSNGALLIVAPQERKVRIQAGDGLTGILTDTACNRIIQNIILPDFRTDNVEQGIIDGTQAILSIILKTEHPANKPDYPNQLIHIIDDSDWPYVRSALIVANGLKAQTTRMKWANRQNGHSGNIILTGAQPDMQGCIQFRVDRQKNGGSVLGADVDFCRDGIIK